MSDRIREDALLRIRDALMDVGCCLDRFEVDSIQCLSWKLHTYIANKSQSLPVRLLESAQIGYLQGDGINAGTTLPSVSARDPTRGRVTLDGTTQEMFQLSLAAIKDSDIRRLSICDPTDDPMTEEQLAQIAAVATTVKVEDLDVFADLTHLPPPALHRLVFGFKSIKELALHFLNVNHLTDDFLRECERRQIWSLSASTAVSDAGPLPFGFQRQSARAQRATHVGLIELEVMRLPLQDQQLGGLLLNDDRGFPAYFEQYDNGVALRLEFGPRGFQATVS